MTVILVTLMKYHDFIFILIPLKIESTCFHKIILKHILLEKKNGINYFITSLFHTKLIFHVMRNVLLGGIYLI